MFIRLMTPTGTKVLLVDGDGERARSTKAMLTDQGYGLAGSVKSVEDLPRRLLETGADAVFIHADRVDPELLAALNALGDGERRPTVLFTEDGEPESIQAAVNAGINAYVVVGVSGNRIKSAVELARANFQSTEGLKEELDEARTALRDRKIIERAKGLIMKEKGLDENEAYKLLRSRAMQKGMRLADVAAMVTEAAEVMK